MGRARRKHLPRAARAYEQGEWLQGLLVGYDTGDVKERLFLAQHKKCAWCERREPLSSSPIEHYRPKNGAWRDRRARQRSPEPDYYYWWLTWTCTNLLFSCPRCNDQGHKANYFPLASGSTPAALPTRPVANPSPEPLVDLSVECPLLLDPADPLVDPLDHIRWVPRETHLARSRWLWSPLQHQGSGRGRETIDVLRLGELAEEIQDHLVRSILPSIEEIEGHLLAGRATEAQARWSTLCGAVLAPRSPFRAATWCALECWMPSATRALHGLPDPPRP